MEHHPDRIRIGRDRPVSNMAAVSLSTAACVLLVVVCTACAPADIPTTSTPTRSPSADAASAVWDEIRRPLVAPTDEAASCPTSRTSPLSDDFGPGAGAGPVFAVVGIDGHCRMDPSTRSAEGLFAVKVLWVAKPDFAERVLVRGQAMTGDRVGFSGSFRDEMHLDATRSRPRPGTWFEWASFTYVPDAGCYFWQLDYPDRSDWIVFDVSLEAALTLAASSP